MDAHSLFEFSPYHILMAGVGAVIILAHWVPRFFSTREPVAAPLLILLGMALYLLVPQFPALPDPRATPKPWEVVSELTVLVALFASGLRLDDLRPWKKWGRTLRLLLVGMPLTILAAALLGLGLAGMTVAGALLVGAVLSPTDPVLAGDVQVGPPHEGDEETVRFTLTTEAALNDGLAFPFVYLGLLVAAEGLNPAGWIGEWLLVDVAYRIGVGALMGIGGGWVLAQILFVIPSHSVLANTGSGVVALAGVLLCYGTTELAEGYGFISVATMGLTLRRVESDHRFHRRLHDFCTTIEHALTAILLVGLGCVLPVLFSELTPGLVLFAVLMIVLVRPLAGWLSLAGSRLERNDRLVVSVYGVRGIGSIYYLCYAGLHMEFVNEAQIWALIGLTILLSTMLHGFTVSHAMKYTSHPPR
ncbi:cation:proton antiporter [Cribrihabitans neustonicus]|uniref:cation:proton antiporter n=1 Tax=Cribrihabitans neustonicus TaxID=1429085 RepID=UPI003B5C125F